MKLINDEVILLLSYVKYNGYSLNGAIRSRYIRLLRLNINTRSVSMIKTWRGSYTADEFVKIQREQRLRNVDAAYT